MKFHLNMLDRGERAIVSDDIQNRWVGWLSPDGRLLTAHVTAVAFEAPRYEVNSYAVWAVEADGTIAPTIEERWARYEWSAEQCANLYASIFRRAGARKVERAYMYGWLDDAIGLVLVAAP